MFSSIIVYLLRCLGSLWYLQRELRDWTNILTVTSTCLDYCRFVLVAFPLRTPLCKAC